MFVYPCECELECEFVIYGRKTEGSLGDFSLLWSFFMGENTSGQASGCDTLQND